MQIRMAAMIMLFEKNDVPRSPQNRGSRDKLRRINSDLGLKKKFGVFPENLSTYICGKSVQFSSMRCIHIEQYEFSLSHAEWQISPSWGEKSCEIKQVVGG